MIVWVRWLFKGRCSKSVSLFSAYNIHVSSLRASDVKSICTERVGVVTGLYWQYVIDTSLESLGYVRLTPGIAIIPCTMCVWNYTVYVWFCSPTTPHDLHNVILHSVERHGQPTRKWCLSRCLSQSQLIIIGLPNIVVSWHDSQFIECYMQMIVHTILLKYRIFLTMLPWSIRFQCVCICSLCM